MGKFEKGQYVRRTKGSSLHTAAGIHEAGFVGQVSAVEISTCGAELLFTNGQRGIADKYEPWVPKVGDRVTTNMTTRVNIERHWNHHFRRSEGDIINGALVVTSVSEKNTGSNIGLSNKEGRSFFFMPESTLRPADPAPAALTIEAGKFYKTRDGRKVGPIVKAQWGYGPDWLWSVEHPFVASCGKAWRADGTFSTVAGRSDEADLVAEWVDEPASNDNGGIASLIGKSVTVQITKPKFEVGDRVNKTDWQSYSPKGYLVTQITSDRLWLDPGNGMAPVSYKLPDEEFWLVTTKPATTPAIVALIENGQPKPSSTPHVHADEAKAGKEAARLAGVYKGKEFGVFVLTSSAQQAAPVYKHEWQRLAANGNKIGAIKELRAANDLTLKGAKDAVEHWLATAA
ncbi:hypothetical protein [Neorhizobium sp. JUb45]|uniref:hypothetical protein n=1 Tax=Neorhizobium sp. JUb45 TaxID=2485113 RepID=UPI001050AB40|nr:hypothetical protein [Neorhizobium sp. JUb45]TCR07222.1 hypothetical protein EDF70_1011193 [Neorhizobium sp. JUb45]